MVSPKTAATLELKEKGGRRIIVLLSQLGQAVTLFAAAWLIRDRKLHEISVDQWLQDRFSKTGTICVPCQGHQRQHIHR